MRLVLVDTELARWNGTWIRFHHARQLKVEVVARGLIVMGATKSRAAFPDQFTVPVHDETEALVTSTGRKNIDQGDHCSRSGYDDA